MLKPLILVTALMVSAATGAQTIRLLTVADSNDANIGSGTTANSNAIADFLKSATAEMNVPFSRQDISGQQFSCANIKHAIDAMDAQPNDVIFFYYSGHGFRTSDNPTKFPDLYCGPDAFTGAAPRLVNVASQLASKNAKLTVVVADACNVMVTPLALPRFAAATAVPTPRIEQYRTLLLRHSGTVVVSGAVTGEYSWYLPTGGLFTSQFVGALNAATAPGERGLWSDVLKIALKQIKVPYGQQYLPQDPESDVHLAGPQ